MEAREVGPGQLRPPCMLVAKRATAPCTAAPLARGVWPAGAAAGPGQLYQGGAEPLEGEGSEGSEDEEEGGVATGEEEGGGAGGRRVGGRTLRARAGTRLARYGGRAEGGRGEYARAVCCMRQLVCCMPCTRRAAAVVHQRVRPAAWPLVCAGDYELSSEGEPAQESSSDEYVASEEEGGAVLEGRGGGGAVGLWGCGLPDAALMGCAHTRLSRTPVCPHLLRTGGRGRRGQQQRRGGGRRAGAGGDDDGAASSSTTSTSGLSSDLDADDLLVRLWLWLLKPRRAS